MLGTTYTACLDLSGATERPIPFQGGACTIIFFLHLAAFYLRPLAACC
jgi:hypothetical protein